MVDYVDGPSGRLQFLTRMRCWAGPRKCLKDTNFLERVFKRNLQPRCSALAKDCDRHQLFIDVVQLSRPEGEHSLRLVCVFVPFSNPETNRSPGQSSMSGVILALHEFKNPGGVNPWGRKTQANCGMVRDSRTKGEKTA
jgi:hypothetical protein